MPIKPPGRDRYKQSSQGESRSESHAQHCIRWAGQTERLTVAAILLPRCRPAKSPLPAAWRTKVKGGLLQCPHYFGCRWRRSGATAGIAVSVYSIAHFDSADGIYWPGMIASDIILYVLPLAGIGGLLGAVCGVIFG